MSDLCAPQLEVTTEVAHKIAAYKYWCVKHKDSDVFIAFKKQFTKSSRRFFCLVSFVLFCFLKGKARLNTKQILQTRKFFTVLNGVSKDYKHFRNSVR